MANNTIQVSVSSSSKFLEGIVNTGVTIAPGELVNLTSAGTYTNVFASAVWDYTATPIVAIENLEYGKDIDDTYLAGERLYMRYLRPGDVGWLWLTTSSTASIGSFLVPDTTGELSVKADLTTSEYFFGISLEAVTTTATRARIKVRIR